VFVIVCYICNVCDLWSKKICCYN